MKKTILGNSLILSGIFFSLFSYARVELPRFLKVSDGIYRSGRPNKDGLEWAKERHQIKTIINLENIPSKISRERNWANDLNLNFYSVPFETSEEPEDEKVDRVLELLVREDLQPVLLHCYHGQDRTGMLIGLHRVEHEGWEAQAAYDEMLDLGFRTFLFELDNYFKERTGLNHNFTSN